MPNENIVKLEYSVHTEAIRLYLELRYIFDGFFVANQWYVLPELGKYSADDPVVILPRLNYFEALNGLKIFKNNERQFKKVDNEVVNKIEKALITSNQFMKISKQELEKKEKEWQKLIYPVIEKAQKNISYLKNKKICITIKPSHFSTCGSFSLFDIDEKQKVINFEVRPRFDQKMEEIIELVASSLTRSAMNSNSNIKWRETEAVSDFFTEYVFGVKNHNWTLDKVSKPRPDLLNKSTKYLLELGLPTGGLLNYDHIENKISLVSENVSNNFAPYEFRLLRGLIENRNITLSYNYLAEELYNVDADERFSLWGITKTVQRVRDKLEDFGIPREAIVNVKGEGFKLVV